MLMKVLTSHYLFLRSEWCLDRVWIAQHGCRGVLSSLPGSREQKVPAGLWTWGLEGGEEEVGEVGRGQCRQCPPVHEKVVDILLLAVGSQGLFGTGGT